MNEHAFKKKTSLDKDLKRIGILEQATQATGQQFVKIGLSVLFLVAVWVFASMQAGDIDNSAYIVAAGIIGGYMALNIGANDVANNVGPAVGSKALTMVGAIIIAAVFETSGAILAGGDVIKTIKKGIIDPSLMPNEQVFIWAMMAALLAAALWLNLATYVGAPVSTTHSIVGGVMGAGIAATGMAAVNWPTMGKIAASWVISPLMGGIIAALFLAFLQYTVMNQKDKIAAARRWVPVVVAVMGSAFAMYLSLKGLKKIWKFDIVEIMIIGAIAYVSSFFIVKMYVDKSSRTMENRKKSVHKLFVVPLIFSAALLSFAHGANDVANAVGPLAAIVSASETGDISSKVGIPLWVMLVGAAGISAGLVLFGPKLIRTVGEKITKLNPVRAFCVALAAAITVIIASYLGLPVSSTHIAVGGVFGVGLYREYISNRKKRTVKPSALGRSASEEITKAAEGVDEMLMDGTPKKKLKRSTKRKLVRRQHLMTIAAAWVITVPAA
ncbi:MAG: inorganic phosphate transporter, partial [Rhodospirillaceae bacterium]|nr:inorganic phosphate transporter [Rhodospirillaceae bacterium]